jgi:hypothetical protein
LFVSTQRPCRPSVCVNPGCGEALSLRSAALSKVAATCRSHSRPLPVGPAGILTRAERLSPTCPTDPIPSPSRLRVASDSATKAAGPNDGLTRASRIGLATPGRPIRSQVGEAKRQRASVTGRDLEPTQAAQDRRSRTTPVNSRQPTAQVSSCSEGSPGSYRSGRLPHGGNRASWVRAAAAQPVTDGPEGDPWTSTRARGVRPSIVSPTTPNRVPHPVVPARRSTVGGSPARQPPSKLAQGSWQAHAVYGASQVTRLVVQNKVAMSVAEAATTIG